MLEKPSIPPKLSFSRSLSRALSLSLSHTHTRARAHTHTHTHTHTHIAPAAAVSAGAGGGGGAKSGAKSGKQTRPAGTTSGHVTEIHSHAEFESVMQTAGDWNIF